MSQILEHLIKTYGLVMDAHQVAEAIGMTHNSLSIARHKGEKNLPVMTKRGSKLVTSAKVVAEYIEGMGREVA
jgi:hypothetical protein